MKQVAGETDGVSWTVDEMRGSGASFAVEGRTGPPLFTYSIRYGKSSKEMLLKPSAHALDEADLRRLAEAHVRKSR